MLLERTPLFNIDGSDKKEDQQIFGGNPTGILNLNNVKYSWVSGLYKVMLNNHWIPEKVSLTKDKVTIKNLTEREYECTEDTLGFLIFLDSMQVNNLPNIADYITCSGCKNLIALQTFQEVVHTQSYQYGLESLFPDNKREEIYNKWRTNPLMLERNKFIAGQMQGFADKPTREGLNKVLIANLALEGIYFYQGFNFFDQLASRNKLVQFQKMIDYIRADEQTHVVLFTKIINETMDTYKERGMIEDMMGTAAEHEIKWSQETYGDSILGISKQSSKEYVQYLTNQRLKGLRIAPIFSDVSNPYAHLDVKSRGNFFETSAMNEYSQSAAVTGWDDF